MILFWVLWVSLVLGGVAGYLCAQAQRLGLGLRLARVAVRKQRLSVQGQRGGTGDGQGPEAFLPLPTITTRPAGPPAFTPAAGPGQTGF